MNGDEPKKEGTLLGEMVTGITEGATVRIMRKHLYERVWKESLAHVGPTLGLWPTRLGKICVKNKIPLPGRGYWFYSTAARKTMMTALPEADKDWEITFLPSQPDPPKPTTDEQNGGRIVVPDSVRRPHRLILEAKNAEKISWCEHGRLRMPDKIRRDKERAEAEKRAEEEAERRRVAERRRLEEEERQAELRRARQRVIEAEQERVDELMADAEAWDQSHKLRAYINACVAKSQASAKTADSGIGPDTEFRKWVAWAHAQADRLDPLTESPPSVLDEIE